MQVYVINLCSDLQKSKLFPFNYNCAYKRNKSKIPLWSGSQMHHFLRLIKPKLLFMLSIKYLIGLLSWLNISKLLGNLQANFRKRALQKNFTKYVEIFRYLMRTNLKFSTGKSIN